MIQPHGGKLINKQLPKIECDKVIENINDFINIHVNDNLLKIIKNICNGTFSPLQGFMVQNDYINVLEHMRLSNDIAWPFPIVLDLSKELTNSIKIGDRIVLSNTSGAPIALMDIEDIYNYDKKEFAQKVFGTLDKKHPGVKNLFNLKDLLIGGGIFLIHEPIPAFPELDLKPIETRVLFKEMKWDKVAAFQTRNPPHLGHEYVQKAALTFTDGIFINPVIGGKKSGDFLDEVIIKAYKVLINEYYPKNRVVLSTFETEMRYAGPKEAIFHAIARKNFGCDFIIIGRDHAGVGNYYGPYDAHEIFKQFPDLGIEPIKFRSFSKCSKCNAIVNDKICPHSPELQKFFAGSEIRKALNAGIPPSPEVMRPEVAEVILKHINPFVS